MLIVGHTHVAFAASLVGGGMIVNPGALLRDHEDRDVPLAMMRDPATGNSVPAPAAGGGTFGVLDVAARRFTVHRAVDGTEVEIGRRTVGIVDRRKR